MCNMVWFLHLFIRFFRVLHVFQVLLILPPSWKWTKSPFWRLNLSSRALFSPKVMGGRVGEASVFWDSGWANPMFFRIFFRGGPPHPLQTLEAGYEKTLRVISHGRRDNNTFPSLPPQKNGMFWNTNFFRKMNKVVWKNFRLLFFWKFWKKRDW